MSYSLFAGSLLLSVSLAQTIVKPEQIRNPDQVRVDNAGSGCTKPNDCPVMLPGTKVSPSQIDQGDEFCPKIFYAISYWRDGELHVTVVYRDECK